MTIEEAIKHCSEKSRGCDECAKEHEQLKEWLVELNEFRNSNFGIMNLGALLAYQGVKEEIDTIVHELNRKGFDEPKGFSVLKAYVDDRMSDLN